MIAPCSTKRNKSDIEERIINSNSSTMSIDQLSLDDDSICATCIDAFDIGDEASSSSHRRCNHVFHYEHITPWSKLHNECPYCRCNYVMPILERTEIENDFICCENHSELAKLGE